MVCKKVYDDNKGIYIYVDPWTGQEDSLKEGAGIFDALASVGQKIFSSSVKEALETAGKQALESGTKRIGAEVGNFAAYKITNVIKGKTQAKPSDPRGARVKDTTPTKIKSPGEMIIKELKKDDIDMRVNKLLSGSGKSLRASPESLRASPESNIDMRVNKLLYKK